MIEVFDVSTPWEVQPGRNGDNAACTLHFDKSPVSYFILITSHWLTLPENVVLGLSKHIFLFV